MSYSISDGDSSSFDIDSSSGVVTFKTAPDYESGKTSYTFSATVSDGVSSDSKSITIIINNINDNTPVLTNATSVSVDENQLNAITLTATDADNDTLTYSISDGDSSSFNIDSSSGVVTFKTAPDYESKNSYTFTATEVMVLIAIVKYYY